MNQYILWLSETIGVKKEKIQVTDFMKDWVLSWLSCIERNVCSVKIYGKGRKTRIVYISSDTATMLKEYCSKFDIKDGALFRNRYAELKHENRTK